jgi:hypothetical protein
VYLYDNCSILTSRTTSNVTNENWGCGSGLNWGCSMQWSIWHNTYCTSTYAGGDDLLTSRIFSKIILIGRSLF